MNVSSDRLYKVYFNPNYDSHSIGISKKNMEGEWTTMYVRLKFKEEDKPKVEDNYTIKIKNGFLTFNEYEGKQTPAIMVLDYEIDNKEEIPF